ncbi:glycosyltransferase family 2 protein [Rouxiella badensis]|uniref:glycosyltransferase family 2 protein n=1 Tax=Rouxiella badensis TaxID=1646377 RepID=UPI003C5907B9
MKDNFNVFALVVVKNEGDIIFDTIESATKWADKIFVIDNMSTDNTWEKLNALKDKYDNVILWGQYGGKFNEGLRQILYREYRGFSSENDWWCRLDGDEFYIDNPKDFLKNLPTDVDHVYNASFQYYYTERDYRNELNLSDCAELNYNRLKWYKCNHSEIRFVKNKRTLCWPQEEGWPCNLLKAASGRIRLKHFQYRTIEQIKNRFLVRSREMSGDAFKHEIVSEEVWYKRRGFSLPNDDELKKHRIVSATDLSDSEKYEYTDTELPKIVHINFKKRIKCLVVALYMKFFNDFLFKL